MVTSTNDNGYFKGIIHNVRIYDRALTESEVNRNYVVNLNKEHTVNIVPATFSQTNSGSTATVNMTFPEECGSAYTCSYIVDDGNPVSVTSSTATTSVTGAGDIVATISDGTNTVTSSYSAIITFKATLSTSTGVSAIGATSKSCTLAKGATTCSITLPSITKAAGYTVQGWYNGTTKVGNANASVSINGNKSFTAKARINVLTIKYHMNGGSLASQHGDDIGTSGSYITKNGSTNVLTCNYNATCNLANWNYAGAINITKTGYQATANKEWGTTTSGGTTFNQETNYTAQAISSNLANGDVTLTLYVNWRANILSIKYHMNGGTMTAHDSIYNHSGNYITENGSTIVQTIKYGQSTESEGLLDTSGSHLKIQKTGCTIANLEWCRNANGTECFDQDTIYSATYLHSDVKTQDKTLILYAHWNC